MFELTKEEKITVKKVVEKLTEWSGLYSGKYDAENGSTEFMCGVSSVMYNLAYLVGDDYGEKFETKFAENMIKSETNLLTNENKCDIIITQ